MHQTPCHQKEHNIKEQEGRQVWIWKVRFNQYHPCIIFQHWGHGWMVCEFSFRDSLKNLNEITPNRNQGKYPWRGSGEECWNIPRPIAGWLPDECNPGRSPWSSRVFANTQRELAGRWLPMILIWEAEQEWEQMWSFVRAQFSLSSSFHLPSCCSLVW